MNDLFVENCNHAFCLECIRKWRKSSGGKKEVKYDL